MIGKNISHYRILEKLGEGGMGIVYKAQDTRLKRTVALKFLPSELTRDEEAKERFIQEAKAASTLQHHNICTIHDIDEMPDGQIFMVLDCYEGETLKEKIKRGPLKIDEAVDITLQIALGLEEAHKHQIIHRDIKPANVFINNSGIVKILDFGLAKLTGRTMLTKAGSTIGTIAYMSPEQTKGEEVNHRTDIWSLGVVLYEMVTGNQPFKGNYDQAVVYSVLNEEPILPSFFRKEIPSQLGQIINKMLEKDPAKRHQSIKELTEDLKKAKPLDIVLPRQEKSIVVLPFENLSPDPDQEYFSDGLTEEVISDLSKVHALRVISRSSAMTFKGTKQTIPEIARQLNVQYMLEGSVRKSGNNLRITAQLIDAENDTHLWAEKYSGTLDDVFDIQEKVSRAIVEALMLKLTPEEKRKMSERPIDNVRAYECYLKASHEIWRFTEDALDRAVNYLQNGLKIIGDNALLYSSMAFAYWQYMNIGGRQEDYIERAEECVKKALEIDSESSQAYAVLGWIHLNPRVDLKASLRYFKKALSINPDEYLALFGLICLYTQITGKISAAIPLAERLMQIDPLNNMMYVFQMCVYLFDGQFDLALEPGRKYYQIEPENPAGQYWYALLLAYHNNFDEAFSIIDRGVNATPNNAFTKMGLLLKYALQKDKKRTFEVLTPDTLRIAQKAGPMSHMIAQAFALLYEKEEALKWLENAPNYGMINYPLLNEKDPFLQNIRGEERFKKLMERVKYEWEHFEV